MPITSFWLMNTSIDRIRAESDMRSLSVQMCSNSGEASESYRKTLVLELGEVVVGSKRISTERDEIGFNELRSLA